jgi:hypothetical protein
MIRLIVADRVAADKLTQLERMGRVRQPQERLCMDLLDALPGDAQPLGDGTPGLRGVPGEAIACHDDVRQPARQTTDQVAQRIADEKTRYLVQGSCRIQRGGGRSQPSGAREGDVCRRLALNHCPPHGAPNGRHSIGRESVPTLRIVAPEGVPQSNPASLDCILVRQRSKPLTVDHPVHEILVLLNVTV